MTRIVGVLRVGASFLVALSLLTMVALSASAVEALGETIDVGETGFDVKRPVLAAACPNGCPWGELGEFVQAAMAPLGYDVVLCRNCNRSYGPPLVSERGTPPPLDRINLFVGTTTRFDAPPEFGITATDNLAFAYKGTGRYSDSGPYRNLRLIARIEDPRWLLVAAKTSSGVRDLGEIAEKKLGIRLLANVERPALQRVLEHYGLSQALIESWGGSVERPSIRNMDAEFDVIMDTNAGPSNNPEAAYWTTYTQQHDLYFLDLPDELLNDLATDEYAMERKTAKWGLLRGVDRAIDTVVRNGHAVFARDDLPDDVAYEIAKAVYQHREALGSFIRPYAYVANKVSHGFGVPLHPGAERFYREKGFLQPACVPEVTKLAAADTIYHPSGYVAPGSARIEEEYEFSCSALGITYRTTFNLERPARDRDFSGVVVMEPTHPGNLWPVRSTTDEYLNEEGHAVIAVNSSTFVVERLVKKANPERYAQLSVPNYSRLESEILHQLAVAIKGGALPFESPRVILAGYSNTGGRVRSYIEYFRERYDDIFDGYLVGQTAVGTLPGPIPDLDVPVIELQGERELIATLNRNPNGLTYRRPDSANFRLYEVPGMAHLDTSDPQRLSFPPSVCGIENVSTFPLNHVWDNTLDLLVRWVVRGEPAPNAPMIETETDGTIVRDEHGNAKAGVPTPQINVPVATILTSRPRNPEYPRARCDMIGPQFDFETAKLNELYGDHRGYMRSLRRELGRLIDEGWYLRMHRDEVIDKAKGIKARFE